MTTLNRLPFASGSPLMGLTEPYPSPEQFINILKSGTRKDREMFVRLWLTEGTPFGFKECPVVYEDLRGWLGNKLNVHPKHITLLGSSRIGFSLASYKLGREFGDHSDLDFSVVHNMLFEDVATTFRRFAHDYYANIIVPRSDYENMCWADNIKFFNTNYYKGFLDVRKIPTLNSYPLAKDIIQAMYEVTVKLKCTPDAPNPKKASIRVYRNWKCLVDRVSFNLSCVLKSLACQPQ